MSSEKIADLHGLVHRDELHDIVVLLFQLILRLGKAVNLFSELALQTGHLLLVGLNTQEAMTHRLELHRLQDAHG